MISSVCISKNGSMIWNYTDASTLTMKKLNLDEIEAYLKKVEDKKLYAYGVYQIEAGGRFVLENRGRRKLNHGASCKKNKGILSNLKC